MGVGTVSIALNAAVLYAGAPYLPANTYKQISVMNVSGFKSVVIAAGDQNAGADSREYIMSLDWTTEAGVIIATQTPRLSVTGLLQYVTKVKGPRLVLSFTAPAGVAKSIPVQVIGNQIELEHHYYHSPGLTGREINIQPGAYYPDDATDKEWGVDATANLGVYGTIFMPSHAGPASLGRMVIFTAARTSSIQYFDAINSSIYLQANTTASQEYTAGAMIFPERPAKLSIKDSRVVASVIWI
jgi:hypothetical protein